MFCLNKVQPQNAFRWVSDWVHPIVVVVLSANCRWPQEMDVCVAYYMTIGVFSCGKQSVQLSTPDISGYDCYKPWGWITRCFSYRNQKSICERGEGPLISNTNLVMSVIFGENLQFEESMPYLTCHTASSRLWKLWQRDNSTLVCPVYIFRCTVHQNSIVNYNN